MEKLVYLCWGGAEAQPSTREALLERCRKPDFAELPGLSVQLGDQVAELGAKKARVIGRGAEVIGAVSVWLTSLDDRAPYEAALRESCEALDGYLVTESIPQPPSPEEAAALGERTPGVTQFTFFPKPAAISDEAFFHAWHEVHTPFSWDLHPLRWSYVRNSVARTLTAGSPPVRAIVEERFATEVFTDSKRYFGSLELAKQSGEEAAHYADLANLHSAAFSQYVLRQPS